MSLAIIAALTDARVIGREGGLPWRLSEDLKRFKRLTLGQTVLMGRKTWESLPKKPLPERLNLVLSSQQGLRLEGATQVRSLGSGIELAKGGLFVIGGEAVFEEALPLAQRLHLTWIHHPFAGDVHFPEFDLGLFEELARSRHTAPEGWDYEFADYQRRNS